jgi:hypothetical protein
MAIFNSYVSLPEGIHHRPMKNHPFVDHVPRFMGVAMIRMSKEGRPPFLLPSNWANFRETPKRIMKLIPCLLCNSSYPNFSHSYHIVSNIYIYSNKNSDIRHI